MFRLHGVLVFAAIVAFSAACLKKASTAVPVETAAISLLVVGDVTADGQPVKTGQLLKGSPWIIVGPASIMDLQVRDSEQGVVFRLKENSKFRLSSLDRGNGKTFVAQLQSGQLLASVKKRSADEEVRINTPTALAGVRGTKFDVYVFQDGSIRTSVYEGSVVTRARLNGVDDVPAELVENSEALKKIIKQIEKSEKVLEPGDQATVAHFVVDAEVQKAIQTATTDPEVRALAEKKDRTPEDIKATAAALDKKLSPQLAVLEKKIQEDLPAAKVEVKERPPAPPGGYPVPDEFKEMQPVDASRSDTEEKTRKEVEKRNQDENIRKNLMVRIEKVTGGKLDQLILKDGKTISGVIRQVGEDYIVTTPEGNQSISGSQVGEMRF